MDETLYEAIMETPMIKDVSKVLYIKNIKRAIEIYKKDGKLEELLRNPDEYYTKLLEYKEVNKLSKHYLTASIVPIMAIFKYNQRLLNENYQLFEKWNNNNKKIKKIVFEMYEESKPTTNKQINGNISFDKLEKIRDDIKDKELHYAKLLLGLYTLIPPVRNDYYDMKIVNDEKDIEDDTKNYLIYNDNKTVIILNEYKTKDTYNKIEIPLPIKLIEIIKWSLNIVPRNYLFITRVNGIIQGYDKSNSFNKYANRLLKKITNNDNISLTLLRYIYVSNLDLENMNLKEKKEIADIMGHSISTQSLYTWKKS